MKTGRKIIIVLYDNQRVKKDCALQHSILRPIANRRDFPARETATNTIITLSSSSSSSSFWSHSYSFNFSIFMWIQSLFMFCYFILDRLRELFSRGNCQCRGEGFRDSGYGSGTTFWFIGCSGNWQDCKDPGLMTSCCREQGKKWTSATVREPIYQ